MGEAAALARYGATSTGTGSTSCEYFYHPDERAASGGLTLLGVNTAAGAAKLTATGDVRFAEVRIIDTSTDDGLARLPTGPPSAGSTVAAAAAAPPVHVPAPAPATTKEQLRNQPAPSIDSMPALPSAYPSFHSGPGNVAAKVVEEFEERLIDEKGMAVHPPLRLLGDKDFLAEHEATTKFKNTLSTRFTMYYAIKTKSGAITDQVLADPKLTATKLIREARDHVRSLTPPGNKFDYYKACCDIYENRNNSD